MLSKNNCERALPEIRNMLFRHHQNVGVIWLQDFRHWMSHFALVFILSPTTTWHARAICSEVSDSGGFHTAECLLVLFWYRVKWRYGGIKKMDNMTETNDRERHWKDDGWHPMEAMSVLVGGVLVTYHFRLRPRETQAPWGSSSFSNPVMPNLEMNQASFYESGPIVHAHTSDVKRSHMSALNVRSGVTLRSPALPFNIPL